MTSIILRTRRPNCQLKVGYALGLYISADYLFEFRGAEKHVLHIVPFRPTRYVLKSFRWLEVILILSRPKSDRWISRHILCEKILNYF